MIPELIPKMKANYNIAKEAYEENPEGFIKALKVIIRNEDDDRRVSKQLKAFGQEYMQEFCKMFESDHYDAEDYWNSPLGLLGKFVLDIMTAEEWTDDPDWIYYY